MSAQIITAHSGCEGTERDSLESIEQALLLDADAIEIDVRRAQNGVLRLSHDLLSEEGYKSKSLAADAFDRIRDTDLLVNCDIKEPAALYYVLDMAADFGLSRDRLIITGCTSAEQLVRDPHLNDRAQVYANIEQLLKYDYFMSHSFADLREFLQNLDEPMGRVKYQFQMDPATVQRVIEYCRLLGVSGLNLPYQVLTDEFAAAMNEAGLPFSVWTVNDKVLAGHILEMHAFNITTRAVKDIVGVKKDFERSLSNA